MSLWSKLKSAIGDFKFWIIEKTQGVGGNNTPKSYTLPGFQAGTENRARQENNHVVTQSNANSPVVTHLKQTSAVVDQRVIGPTQTPDTQNLNTGKQSQR